jgi:hypothetical protein
MLDKKPVAVKLLQNPAFHSLDIYGTFVLSVGGFSCKRATVLSFKSTGQ